MRVLPLLLVFASVAASAQMPPPGRQQIFISPMGQPFRAPEGTPYPVAAWFAQADADHDGKLTLREFEDDALAFFKTLDANHDKVIDGHEIDVYENEIAPEVHAGGFGAPGAVARGDGPAATDALPGGGYGGHGGTGLDVARPGRRGTTLPRGGGRYGLIDIPEPVVSADVELNRRITIREWLAAADRRFAVLDPDAAGYLVLAKLPQTPVQDRGLFRAVR